jgi:hypothetical protein
MHATSLFRNALLALPLLFFLAACDTVGDTPVIDSATASSGMSPSPGEVTIAVTPSSPQAGESVSLTLDIPSDYDMGDATPAWTLETGESLGTGLSVEHVFDTPGEYGVSVTGLPDVVNVERVVSVASE